MLEKVSDNAVNFLEPSAGKGDLAVLMRGDSSYQHGRGKVDCIESHPELVSILREKNFPVVGFDWLDYDGVCYYDAIVMNPPFSNGAAHLLKAWDFLHDGEIVCLLNAETLRNPYTEERKRLVRLIEENGGEVEDLGDCFRHAERGTGVEVVMVHLKKVAVDDRFDLWSTDTTEREQDWVGPEEAALAIRDELGNMEQYFNEANSHFVKAFEHLRKAAIYLESNGISIDSDFEKVAGMALKNRRTAYAEAVRHHRLEAWSRVFDKMQFHRWLDSKQQEDLLRDVKTSADIPFTADNIKGTLANILENRTKLFEQSVANVFDELCSHYPGNGTSEGWKSNSDFKVNKRLVFPYGCRFDAGTHGSRHFSTWGNQRARTAYTDLDRVLCVLSGTDFANCHTVGSVLDKRFSDLGYGVHAPFDNEIESEFFKIRFFMKGTIHLYWKDKELWERFNQKASAGKKWLGRGQEAA